MDVDELRRQQYAIKSFTESVDEDIEEEWQRRHSGGIKDEVECGMKESSTDETIIEVKKHNDPTKGETQKYTMRVSCPELVDQEFELHKSLVHSASGTDFVEDEESEANTTTLTSTPNISKEKNFKCINTNVEEENREDEACASYQYSNTLSSMNFPTSKEHTNLASRPRISSPNKLFSLSPKFETFEIEAKDEKRNNSLEKLKVVLPPKTLKSSQRRYSMSTTELICQGPLTLTRTRIRCDSTAATLYYNKSGEDIIESNPEYAKKAPKKPVVHRRQSRDWENFPEEERNTEDEELIATDNLELAKQLQKQVHKLIDEVEQHNLQLEAESNNIEIFQTKMDYSEKPISSNMSNISLPPLSDSSCENTFETPAQFTSEHFASAQQYNQREGNVNDQSAHNFSQMSQEFVETKEEAHWSTKMEIASEINRTVLEEAGNPFNEKSIYQPYEATQKNWETQNSQQQYETYISGAIEQQQYQQQSYVGENGYYYENGDGNQNYQDYTSVYEQRNYYPTEYATNTYGIDQAASTSTTTYQYEYNYSGHYGNESNPEILPTVYSSLNPFNDDGGNSLEYQTDLPPPPATDASPVDVSVYGSPPRAPPIPPLPVTAVGLGLPAFTQKSRASDPFSWEAQESEIEQLGAPLPPRQKIQL